MKSVLYIIAVIVLLVAAFFGYQLMTQYEDQLAATADLVNRNQVLSSAIDDKKEEKGTAGKTRDTSRSGRDDANSELELASAKSGQLRSTEAKIDARIEEAQAELDEVNKLVAEMKKTLPGITMANLPSEIKRLKTEKTEKENRLSELDTVNTKMEEDIVKKGSDLEREQGILAESRERVRANKLEAPVTAVNNEWGFVIVGAGEEVGLTSSSKLLVKRAGRLIGKLTISSLESNQAIADVVPDSLAVGARIQKGDRVILQKTVSN